MPHTTRVRSRHDGAGRSVRHAGQRLKTQSRTRSREMRTFVSAVAAGVMLAVPALAADGDMLTIRLNSDIRNLEPGGVRDSNTDTVIDRKSTRLNSSH